MPTPAARTGRAVPTAGVLFGGETRTSGYGDTWVRAGAAIMYGTATGHLLPSGGQTRGGHNDTWVWKGTTWRRLPPATAPAPRHHADTAYGGGQARDFARAR